MGLIDTHTHLESFVRNGGLVGALARAKVADLEAMITIGTSPDDWSLYRDLTREHRGFIHYSVGLHPCAVEETWAEVIAQVESYWVDGSESSPAPVALGEIGLDRFHLPKDDLVRAEQILGWQRAAFTEGLAIAKRLSLPVVIHSRGAFSECVELIDASGVDWTKVVFHCFVETERDIAELSRRGGYGSFTGVLTYKNAETVRGAARAQGLARFMVETDAPYLTPMPHRGKPNEPAYVRHIADYAAELFGVSYAQLAATSTETAKRFFGLR